MEGKRRLIVDFDNKEELNAFYESGIGGDLKNLKHLEDRSIPGVIETYKTEFEADIRAFMHKDKLKNKIANAIKLAQSGELFTEEGRKKYMAEIVLLDYLNDYLELNGIIEAGQVFYSL